MEQASIMAFLVRRSHFFHSAYNSLLLFCLQVTHNTLCRPTDVNRAYSLFGGGVHLLDHPATASP